jgi:hypothetical protein
VTRQLAPLRVYRTTEEQRLIAKLRRRTRTALGICINGVKHGDATHGIRCRRCAERHGGYAALAAS